MEVMDSFVAAMRKVDTLMCKLKPGHPVDSSIVDEIKSEVDTLDEQVSSECKDHGKGLKEEFEAHKHTLQKLEGEIKTLKHILEEMNFDSRN